MDLVSVECNHCGAPLEVSEGTKFVTCKHCRSRLMIRDTGSARFTEKLDEIAGSIEVIQLQNELERLDREWMMERESHMVPDSRGGRSKPSPGGSIFLLVAHVGAAFFFGVMGVSGVARGSDFGFFPILAIIFLIAAIFTFISTVEIFARAERFRATQNRYQARRNAIVHKLDNAR